MCQNIKILPKLGLGVKLRQSVTLSSVLSLYRAPSVSDNKETKNEKNENAL